jgi:hypothetical protein
MAGRISAGRISAGRISTGVIGFGGETPARGGAAHEPRFAAPRAVHPGALWLAAAAPLAATLLLLAARLAA